MSGTVLWMLCNRFACDTKMHFMQYFTCMLCIMLGVWATGFARVSRSWVCVCVYAIASAPRLPTRVQVDRETVFAEVMRNSLPPCPRPSRRGRIVRERRHSCQRGGDQNTKDIRRRHSMGAFFRKEYLISRCFSYCTVCGLIFMHLLWKLMRLVLDEDEKGAIIITKSSSIGGIVDPKMKIRD